MPTVVSHFLIGWGACRFVDSGNRAGAAVPLLAGVLAAAPDADVLLMPWCAYGDPWGHRGLSHSLVAAVLLGVGATLALRRRAAFPGGAAGLAATLSLAVASHGLLDALTDGGLGVALLAPFDHRRIFFAARPIPVSPITTNLGEPRLLGVLGQEALLLWPAAALLAVARRNVPTWIKATAVTATVASAGVWGARLA